MAHVEYVLPLGDRVRKRHIHETTGTLVISFVVQLEVSLDGRWLPVVRYDCAHGFSHVHWYKRSGEFRREPLSLSFAESLTMADEDILEGWETHRNRFVEGEWP